MVHKSSLRCAILTTSENEAPRNFYQVIIWALGKTWNGMEWNGLEWNGMEWNGREWNGMEWIGLEWNGMELYQEHFLFISNLYPLSPTAP